MHNEILKQEKNGIQVHYILSIEITCFTFVELLSIKLLFSECQSSYVGGKYNKDF